MLNFFFPVIVSRLPLPLPWDNFLSPPPPENKQTNKRQQLYMWQHGSFCGFVRITCHGYPAKTYLWRIVKSPAIRQEWKVIAESFIANLRHSNPLDRSVICNPIRTSTVKIKSRENPSYLGDCLPGMFNDCHSNRFFVVRNGKVKNVLILRV